MFAQLRRRLRRQRARRPESQRRPWSGIDAELGVIDVGEQRVRGRRARVAADQFLERLVWAPHHLLRVEGGRDAVEGPYSDPRLQQFADLLAPSPAIAFVVEVEAEPCLDVAKLSAHARRLDEAAPLPRREGEHDHAPAVARDEVATEGAIHVVAETAARLVLQYRLADQTEMPRHREPDIGEAELDQLALAGQAAVSLGGEDGGRRKETSH